MKKEKIQAFDFIRALCTVGIVLFHYSFNYIEYGISGQHLMFAKYTNGDWGGLFVAVFFMLSGAVLWYNYGEKINVLQFYGRRWLSIFPMFYLAWFVGYLLKVQELGSWLWAGPKKVFIYTILGIDGYLLNPGVNINYYTLGEWFLGAIIFLYVIFPLLRLVFRSWPVIGCVPRYVFTLMLAAVYTGNLYNDWFAISDGKNLITCLMDFWLGMLIMELWNGYIKAEEKRKLISTVCFGMLTLVLMFAPLSMKEVMVSTTAAFTLTMVLLHLGELAMKNKVVAFVCGKLSAFSFGIFLVHHVMLYAFMKQFQGGSIDFIKSVVIFIIILLVITVVGGLLSMWGSFISGLFRKKKG